APPSPLPPVASGPTGAMPAERPHAKTAASATEVPKRRPAIPRALMKAEFTTMLRARSLAHRPASGALNVVFAGSSAFLDSSGPVCWCCPGGAAMIRSIYGHLAAIAERLFHRAPDNRVATCDGSSSDLARALLAEAG